MSRLFLLRHLTILCCTAVFALSLAVPAQAAKECKPGHWHYGASNGPFKTKRAAMRDAIRSWASFTDFEYGSAWAFFKLAANRGSKCERVVGNRWTCSVEGRPCKRVRRSRRR